MNVVTEIVPEPGSYRDYMPPHGHSHAGLYQCTRCKTISIGVPR